MNTLVSCIKRLMASFLTENLPKHANGQVIRVGERFALISAAGALATMLGITSWPDDEAPQAVRQCFQAYLEQRGGIDNQESHLILAQVKGFFEAHGSSRFEVIGGSEQKIINRVGFKKTDLEKTWFYVLPEAFKQEICQGYDPRVVAKLLLEKQWLLPDMDGKSTRPERLPGMPLTRCYVITGNLWKL